MLEHGADVFAELPFQFLHQFKNYRQPPILPPATRGEVLTAARLGRWLSHHLKRASCHAAALSAHFKDEGWKECVALLEAAVEKRKCSERVATNGGRSVPAEIRNLKVRTLSTTFESVGARALCPCAVRSEAVNVLFND